MLTRGAFKGLGLISNVNNNSIKYLIKSKRFAHHVTKILSHVKPYIPPHKVDLDNQSCILPGPERIRASRLTEDPTKLYEDIPDSPHIKSVFDFLDHGLKLSDDGECVGSRSESGEYEWLKYSEVKLKAQYLGSAFVHLGLKTNSESYLGVFSSNRIECFLTIFACCGYSIVLVPIFDHTDPNNVQSVIQQANLSMVIANNEKNTRLILENVDKIPSLKILITMVPLTDEFIKLSKKSNIQLLPYSHLEKIGKENLKDFVLPKKDDLFCIPFTSGTTGFPKGVMLTHRNIISCLTSLIMGYGHAAVYGGTIMSFLPPAHVYEIMNMVASIFYARRIAFYSGDLKKLMDEIQYLKPNILTFVPRIMNAIVNNVYNQVRTSKLKQFMLELALSKKEKLLKKGIVTRNTIWDKFVLKKIQEALGGNADIIVTTSAPCPKETIRFFKCAAGCHIFEAYGQTETMAATFTLPHEIIGDHVGPPLPSNYIKLVDVPDMGYYSKNDEGEVCVKGSSVCKGYFHLPDASGELIKDGWLKTGDIGKWLPNGTLKIIDRKKHIFKLSQGEFVAPENIEIVYLNCELLLQIYVDGFSDKDFLTAIVVPNPEVFLKWAKNKGFALEKDKLISNKDVRLALLQELRTIGSGKKLNSIEQIRNLHLTWEPFSIENNLLTPTLKAKRNHLRQHFRPVIDKMYEEGRLL